VLSPVSLTPLLVAAMMFIPLSVYLHRLAPAVRAILLMLIAAVVYAFAVGFLRVQFAALYGLAEVLAPLGLFGFVLMVGPNTRIKDRWIRSFAWAAILASVYGWYQVPNDPSLGWVLAG